MRKQDPYHSTLPLQRPWTFAQVNNWKKFCNAYMTCYRAYTLKEDTFKRPLDTACMVHDFAQLCHVYLEVQRQQAPLSNCTGDDVMCEQSLVEAHAKEQDTPFSHQYLQAFFTGYYRPLLRGSHEQSDAYPIPLHTLPPLHRRHHARARITQSDLLKDDVCVYVSCPVDAFFLEIQGSGRIVFEDGQARNIGYAGQNGHPYKSLGKLFLSQGLLAPEHIHLQGLKTWLKQHPKEARSLMEHNTSYVYFKWTEDIKETLVPSDTHQILPHLASKMTPQPSSSAMYEDMHKGPIGTHTLPLAPFLSVACDPSHWHFGTIMMYEGYHPVSRAPITSLALMQDTGGAIKGKDRFDLYTGDGDDAELWAGHLQHTFSYLAFEPRLETVHAPKTRHHVT